jgi:acetamidase/formamidase
MSTRVARCLVLIATALLSSTGVQARAQASATSFKVLQPLGEQVQRMTDPVLHREVFYVPTMLEFVRWGRLPNATTPAAVTVPSGSLVTFDIVSHEGVLEDQGRDPVRFFAQFGIPREQVLNDAIRVAASNTPHDFARDGPHVITASVAVTGAERGDVLRVDVVALEPRVPYGVTSIRHGKGSLPTEFPMTPPAEPGADAAHPERYHNVSILIAIHRGANGWEAVQRTAGGRVITFPVHPFVGTMGVAVDTTATLSSIPPGPYGGNMDLRHLTVGSTLYLPVELPGARFFMADSHFNEGNGEVDLTAIEGSLRATVRLTLLKAGSASIPLRNLAGPFAETAEYWIPMGLNPDLNEAMRMTVRQAIDFLVQRFGMTPTEAYAYLSIRTDFDVTEVVDITKGIHALIPKRDFGAGQPAGREERGSH